jgi:ribosomal protein L37AE/L43A
MKKPQRKEASLPTIIFDVSASSVSRREVEGGKDEIEQKVVCPVCGAAVVQEKCKMICRSDVCRGRVVMNCSEF